MRDQLRADAAWLDTLRPWTERHDDVSARLLSAAEELDRLEAQLAECRAAGRDAWAAGSRDAIARHAPQAAS